VLISAHQAWCSQAMSRVMVVAEAGCTGTIVYGGVSEDRQLFTVARAYEQVMDCTVGSGA
jgi:hypothetical protein